MGEVLALTQINKSFGQHQVLHDVSLNMEEGQVFGFLGPNGAGKTTLIRIILGLMRANSGRVELNGYDIKKDFRKAIAKVGAVVETPKFFDNLTGQQNLSLVQNLHRHVTQKDVYRVLELVGLQERAADKAGTYSLGMKQRLGLARAVLHSPQLVFLDEPMNGLDPQGMVEIRALIRTLKQQGISFFITSHLLYEVEQVCDHIAIIKDGAIIKSGSLAELLQKETEKVELFTQQLDNTLTLLASLPWVKKSDRGSTSLMVTLERGRSAELNRLLVSQNIQLDYLVPKKHSLEEYFMSSIHQEEVL